MHCHDWIIKGESGKSSERKPVEKISNSLEDTSVFLNKILVVIQMMKSILMWFWTKMRSMLLDTGEKVILVIKWKIPWLNCVYVPVFCGRFSSVHSLSRVRLFATSWTAAHQASMSIINSRSLPKLISIETMPSNHLILCHPLLLLPSNLSQHQGLFKWVSPSHQVAKYWSFSFSISPSNEYSGLISFSIYWLDLLPLYRIFKTITTSLC